MLSPRATRFITGDLCGSGAEVASALRQWAEKTDVRGLLRTLFPAVVVGGSRTLAKFASGDPESRAKPRVSGRWRFSQVSSMLSCDAGTESRVLPPRPWHTALPQPWLPLLARLLSPSRPTQSRAPHLPAGSSGKDFVLYFLQRPCIVHHWSKGRLTEVK